jgi:hypothetical protein
MKRYYNILVSGARARGTIFLGDLFDGVTKIMMNKAKTCVISALTVATSRVQIFYRF